MRGRAAANALFGRSNHRPPYFNMDSIEYSMIRLFKAGHSFLLL
jgi:hypothetical protein